MARGNTPPMEAAPRSLENLIGAGRERQGQEFKKLESLGGLLLVLEDPEADRRFLSSRVLEFSQCSSIGFQPVFCSDRA
jgi:hypothetical protein